MKQAIYELDQQQPICQQEQQKRQRAMRFAKASVGFKPSPEALAHAERYAAGEIDLKTLVEGKFE
jgi:hypothetical protein